MHARRHKEGLQESKSTKVAIILENVLSCRLQRSIEISVLTDTQLIAISEHICIVWRIVYFLHTHSLRHQFGVGLEDKSVRTLKKILSRDRGDF